MNYFAAPGYIQHDKGIMYRGGTVAKPRHDIIRVKELQKGDNFRMGKSKYKVVEITKRKLFYLPYIYHHQRKRSFLDCAIPASFGRQSNQFVILVNTNTVI